MKWTARRKYFIGGQLYESSLQIREAVHRVDIVIVLLVRIGVYCFEATSVGVTLTLRQEPAISLEKFDCLDSGIFIEIQLIAKGGKNDDKIL